MKTEKKAAFEELAESALSNISADQLLEAASDLDHRLLAVWPEKKKVELELEPGSLRNVRLRDLFGRLRNEKKKYELEIDPVTRVKGPILDFRSEKKKAELEIDPGLANVKPSPQVGNGASNAAGFEQAPAGSDVTPLDLIIDQLEERFRGRGAE